MDDEFQSLVKNQTWELQDLASHRQPITCKWLYKLKHNADGLIARYKARLVAKGFSQLSGLDYGETFALVAKGDSIRTLLSIAAAEDYEILQFDIKTAFLYGNLDEEIFMHQVPGYEVPGKQVYRLRKSLYG